ncbi:hypothetical protein B0H66DRAFT_180425 [Apodospora peruviana]|uniref:Uncharacterized protein n=1 Tax=Apodospora peruviana TaxID=516989 RepID=A0AAE0IAT3_9PEZI|nr:hypothetical protein B0H66DRAFT_180425 [Apodospora peruviana]
MPETNPDPVAAELREFIATQQTKRRQKLEGELSEIDARIIATATTLQDRQAAIQMKQEAMRVITEAIRVITEESEALRRQDSADRDRREEISRDLDPDALRNQIRRWVFLLTRSASVLDETTHNTTPRATATENANLEQPSQLEGIQEEPEEPDNGLGEQAQEFRRSSRKRAVRRYDDPRLSSPEAGPRRKKRKTIASSSAMVTRDAREPIEFDQVYADGNAVIKYNIAAYPKNSNRWYILRCLEHNKHFFRGALQAGAKHLSGKLHGLDRSQELAFKMFSVQVLNCDATKAELNNRAVKEAAEAGYRTPEGTGEQGQEFSTITIRNRGSRSSKVDQVRIHSDVHVEDPTPGEIYGITWLEKPAIVVILPTGDLSGVGMTGRTITAIGLPIPSCYQSRKDGSYHWAYHYQHGKTRVLHRQYPVMAFQEGMVIPHYPDPFHLPLGHACYDFVKAFQLSPINLDEPENQGIEGIELAKIFRARMDAVRERNSQSNDNSDHCTQQHGHTSDQVPVGNADDHIDDNVDDDDADWSDMRSDIDTDTDSGSDTDSDDGHDNDGGGDDDKVAQVNAGYLGNSDRLGESDDQARPGTAQAGHQTSHMSNSGSVASPALAVNAGGDHFPSPEASRIARQPEEVSRSRDRQGSAHSVPTSLEAPGARSMTTAELGDYLLSLQVNLDFGQDHTFAGHHLEQPGPTLPTQQPNQMNCRSSQPAPVKEEIHFHSRATSTVRTDSQHTARRHEVQGCDMDVDGLPVVEHIDITCPDSSPEYEDHSDQDMTEEEEAAEAYNTK